MSTEDLKNIYLEAVRLDHGPVYVESAKKVLESGFVVKRGSYLEFLQAVLDQHAADNRAALWQSATARVRF